MGGGGVILVLYDYDNGAVGKRGWKRRDSRIYYLFCTDAAGMRRDSSSNHEGATNDD